MKKTKKTDTIVPSKTTVSRIEERVRKISRETIQIYQDLGGAEAWNAFSELANSSISKPHRDAAFRLSRIMEHLASVASEISATASNLRDLIETNRLV